MPRSRAAQLRDLLPPSRLAERLTKLVNTNVALWKLLILWGKWNRLQVLKQSDCNDAWLLRQLLPQSPHKPKIQRCSCDAPESTFVGMFSIKDTEPEDALDRWMHVITTMTSCFFRSCPRPQQRSRIRRLPAMSSTKPRL